MPGTVFIQQLNEGFSALAAATAAMVVVVVVGGDKGDGEGVIK